MFTTDLVNLYNRNIFKTSLYFYIFQDEKCRFMRNLSLFMIVVGYETMYAGKYMNQYGTPEAGGSHQVKVVDHYVSRAGWTFFNNCWLMVS